MALKELLSCQNHTSDILRTVEKFVGGHAPRGTFAILKMFSPFQHKKFRMNPCFVTITPAPILHIL